MNSLRRQLTRTLLGVLSLLLAATLVAMSFLARHELLGTFDAALHTKALAVSSLVETEDGRVQFDFSDDFLLGFGAKRPRDFFEIWDATGKVIARSPSLGVQDLPQPDRNQAIGSRASGVKLPTGRPGRFVGFDFEVKPADPAKPMIPAPHVRLAVAVDSENNEETFHGLLTAFAVCGVLLFGAVWIVLPWALKRGLMPLERLGAEVGRLDADTLSAPLSVDGLPTELVPVVERLNALLARLAVSFERERRFSADLAHELRTPLAELRSMAECALKWPEARDPETDREVLTVAVQMETLVSRMLLLARGEQSQLAATLEPVDLPVLANEVWRPLVALAAERELVVSMAIAPAVVSADPVLLRGVLHNLFDNAVAHAPVGAKIRVSGAFTADGRGYVVRLANPAGDLTAKDVAQLFERFWRKEAARTSEGKHFGLGLSLGRMFAVAMKGRLNAALTAEGWLEFTLELETAQGRQG